jgi:hypothetical protein
VAKLWSYRQIGDKTYEVVAGGVAVGVIWRTVHGWSGRTMPPEEYQQFPRTAGAPVMREFEGRPSQVAARLVEIAGQAIDL